MKLLAATLTRLLGLRRYYRLLDATVGKPLIGRLARWERWAPRQ